MNSRPKMWTLYCSNKGLKVFFSQRREYKIFKMVKSSHKKEGLEEKPKGKPENTEEVAAEDVPGRGWERKGRDCGNKLETDTGGKKRKSSEARASEGLRHSLQAWLAVFIQHRLS